MTTLPFRRSQNWLDFEGKRRLFRRDGTINLDAQREIERERGKDMIKLKILAIFFEWQIIIVLGSSLLLLPPLSKLIFILLPDSLLITVERVIK
jgi:hypothetical protein